MSSEGQDPQQINEYRAQLAEVEELLQGDPNDESLLTLQKDLKELIALTGAPSAVDGEQQVMGGSPDSPGSPQEGPFEAGEGSTDVPTTLPETNGEQGDDGGEESKAITKPKKKSTKVPSTFQVPPHLVPLESDSEAERNRKRRNIKALKNKWRERVKEVENDQKQRSWQAFSKKKRKQPNSIFATEDGIHARVGVITGVTGGRNMTEFGERKRHKHV